VGPLPLYSHSPVLFVQGVAGMSWDAFKHSPFPLTSTAIWVNSYPGNLRCVATWGGQRGVVGNPGNLPPDQVNF
jgi:hypothetical protein